MEKPYLITNLGFKNYIAYTDKIIFKTKTSKRFIKIPKTLKTFAEFKKAYVKLGSKYRKLEIRSYKEKQLQVYYVYIGKHAKNKFDIYLKTNKLFSNALKKSLGSKPLMVHANNNKVIVDRYGIIILRFLVSSIKDKKLFHTIHNYLQGRSKSILFKHLKNIVKTLDTDIDFSPFIENYFVAMAKQELNIPHNTELPYPREFYRSAGLINGDGHLNQYGVHFYNTDKVLHSDFKKGLKTLFPTIEFKQYLVRGGVDKTYMYSYKVAKRLSNLGVISGKKVDATAQIEFAKSFYAISEYLSGIFDAEGCFIDDSHIVIPTSKLLWRDDSSNNEITSDEYKFLLDLSIKHGRLSILPSGSKCYIIGLKILRKTKEGKEILEKTLIRQPQIALHLEKIFINLGIGSKTELKSLAIYPNSRKIVSYWWVKITPIKDVIKLASIIDIHSSIKKKAIEKFIFNYLSKTDFSRLKNYFKGN